MKKIDLGQMISILANIGVIGGIVFLAIEVSQNEASLREANTINRISALSQSLQEATAWQAMLAEDEGLATIFRAEQQGEELSDVERVRLNFFCASAFQAYAVAFERMRLLGEEARAEATVQDARLWAKRIACRGDWPQLRGIIRRNISGEFVERVDEEPIREQAER